MNEKEILDLFSKTGALLSGHFELTSGLHSDQYFQCALVLQHPNTCQLLARDLKEKFAGLAKPDLVIGPALGGVTLAYELARAFGVRGLFAERKEAKMELRRGFKIESGSKVIVVEDVVTTGGSVQEVVELCKREGAEVLACGAIVDRSSKPPDFGVPFHSLIKMKVQTYKPGECPLCLKGIRIDKPGSRKPPHPTLSP